MAKRRSVEVFLICGRIHANLVDDGKQLIGNSLGVICLGNCKKAAMRRPASNIPSYMQARFGRDELFRNIGGVLAVLSSMIYVG